MKLGFRKRGYSRLKLSESEAVPGMVELTALYTEEAHRNNGSANRLMDMICEEADKANRVLMLMPDSEWLERWYASHGFETVQVEPKVIMARPPYRQ